MRRIITTLAFAALAAPAAAQTSRVAPSAAEAAAMQVELAVAPAVMAVAALEPALAVMAHAALETGLAMATPLEALTPRISLALHEATALRAAAPLMARVLPPDAWAQEDPADSLWRAARQALDRGEHAAAAAAYRRIRTESRFARSAYRPHAYYWEAFARHRIGSAAELRTARNVLDALRRDHPSFESMAEAERLSVRIHAELAARGDAQSASRAATTAAHATSCPEQDLRAAAVEALITMPAEHAMPVLQQVMARKDACNAKLRETAVWMIAQKGGANAEQILLDAAKSDPEPKVRQQAVFWLAQVNSDRAIDAIQEILRTSPDQATLDAALFAASQHKHPRAAQLLRDVATSQTASTDLRKNAIFMLGQRRDPENAAFLRNIYGSAIDAAVKEAVIYSLAMHARDGDSEWLLGVAMNQREPMEARKQALFWAGKQSTIPLNRLVELYGSMQARDMKEQIIYTLSQRREPEALDRLIDIARRENDADLRRNILFWIGKSNDPRAARFLAELIGG